MIIFRILFYYLLSCIMALNLNFFYLLVLKLNFLHISASNVHKKYSMCFINVLTLNVV